MRSDKQERDMTLRKLEATLHRPGINPAGENRGILLMMREPTPPTRTVPKALAAKAQPEPVAERP